VATSIGYVNRHASERASEIPSLGDPYRKIIARDATAYSPCPAKRAGPTHCSPSATAARMDTSCAAAPIVVAALYVASFRRASSKVSPTKLNVANTAEAVRPAHDRGAMDRVVVSVEKQDIRRKYPEHECSW